MYRSLKEEIRSEISLLRELMNLNIRGYNKPRQKRLDSVADFKRRLRSKIKQYNNRNSEDERHYTSDGEGYYYKEWFSYPFTEEDKQEYIEDNWVHINAPWSPTGEWFTRNIVVCNVNGSENGKSVAYHFMSLDV